MQTNKKQPFLLLMVLLQCLSLNIAHAQINKLPNGIAVKTGNHQIALTTVNNAAFCISLNRSDEPSTIKSIFIDDDKTAANNYTVITAAPVYGIKTAYGKLVINTATQAWSLYNTSGKLLVQSGTFGFIDTAVQISHNAKGLFYGSGNQSSKKLEKDKSKSGVGNGTADIPYFWNNSGYSEFGVSANDDKPAAWELAKDKTKLTWTFAGNAANLYLWPAPTMQVAASGYVKLTGKPKLPPRWAFGFLQSKWGWDDSTYVADVAAKFRSHKLPVDAFIFDFEWYTVTPDYSLGKNGKDDFTDFKFNPKVFPSPAKQINDLKAQNIKFIGIRKPRLGNTASLDTARKEGWLISPKTDNRDLNFSNPDLRKWFEARTKPMLKTGVDAWWDDEGESYYTCYYWWNTAQYDLLNSTRPNYRHFTINRAFSPGNQRFGYCTWNGDIYSTWAYLADVPKDLLNFSLAGMYYGACDIGGFHGTPAKELLVRWFQAGVFFPIMRAHSDIGTTARFPFLWGEDGEAAIRKALNLRYQLLPYIYSLGHEAYNTGTPIMRPLVMEYPTDKAVAGMTDEWLLGKGLLAAPLLNQGGKRSVYLPAGTWYDYFTGEAIKGAKTIAVNKKLDEIPLYVSAGTILPIGPVIQYSEQIVDAPLQLHIYPGKNGSFKLIEDDGDSYNYTKGNTKTTAFYWNDKTQTLTWQVSGPYAGKATYKNIKVILGRQELMASINQKGNLVFKR